jgi:hypothetical protein
MLLKTKDAMKFQHPIVSNRFTQHATHHILFTALLAIGVFIGLNQENLIRSQAPAVGGSELNPT